MPCKCGCGRYTQAPDPFASPACALRYRMRDPRFVADMGADTCRCVLAQLVIEYQTKRPDDMHLN